MRRREDIHAEFVSRFAVTSTSHPARNRPPSDIELDVLETAIGARFPRSYREFVTRYGCVWTTKLDDHLEATGRAVSRSIAEFAPVAGMFDFDKWNASIPQPLLLFAQDSLGDVIGFPKQAAETDDLPVFVFDHEFNEVIRLAESFDALLSACVHGGSASR